MGVLSRKTPCLPVGGIFVRPCGVDLTGSNVSDIIPEGHRHVAGGSCRLAQMHRDIFGDDDLIQHPGRAVLHRLRSAAAAARKQSVRRDDDGRVRDVPVFLGDGQHLELRQRYLPGKDLDALNAHGAVAGLCGGQADNGIGAGGVVLVQREGAGGGFNGNVGGAAGSISDAVQGKAVPPAPQRSPPSTGADWRAAKVWMRRVPVFFMEIRSFAGKSMLLPQRIPSGARACMAMSAANKKSRPKAAGENSLFGAVLGKGGVNVFFAGRQGFLPCQCRPAGADPQRCRPGQKRRWWGRP